MPSVLLNQACDLNALARKTADSAEKRASHEESANVVTEGQDRLAADHSSQGLRELREWVEKECEPAKDLYDLPDDLKSSIVNYQPKARPTTGTPTLDSACT